MEDETRELWLDKHSKRKQEILEDLKKYFKVCFTNFWFGNFTNLIDKKGFK